MATLEQSMVSTNYCTFSGKYMIVPINRINTQSAVQKMLKERHSELLIQRSYVDCDTMIYKIPSNYKVESVPAGKAFKSPFGEYTSSLNVKNGQIIFIRKYTINEGRYKASEYKNFYEYVLSVSKSDNEKAMLVKIDN